MGSVSALPFICSTEGLVAQRKFKKVIQIQMPDHIDSNWQSYPGDQVIPTWADTCWSSIRDARRDYPNEEYRVVYV